MQDTGSLAVLKVTARDHGHYKRPLGVFVTYCNISCVFLGIHPHTKFQAAKMIETVKCTSYKNPHTKFQVATITGTLKCTSYKHLNLSLTGSRIMDRCTYIINAHVRTT